MTLEQIAPPPMSILNVTRARRSAGRFGSEPPSRDLVEQLLDAARWAPNHHLTEPWRFTVVSGAARAALGDAVASEILSDPAAGSKSGAEAAGLRTKVMRSPVIVVVGQKHTSDDPERDLEDYAACCCATQNLLLAAQDAGLVTKWSTGKMARSEAAKRFCGLEPADRIVGYIYLGYPAGETPGSHRRPVSEVTQWLGWDEAGDDRSPESPMP
jgi:nitroreductase